MNFLSCRSRGAAALLLAVAGSCSAEAPATHAGIFSVVAFAADVHAVVMRAPDGQLHRYSNGDALPDSGWRVLDVTATGVTLQSDIHLYGQPLRTTLQAGGRIDLDAANRMSASVQTPITAPDRVTVQTIKHSEKSGH